MSEKKYKTFADLKLVPVKVEQNTEDSKSKSDIRTGGTPVTPVTGDTPVTPVAPVKNFQKVTNTITREAIPNGLFKSGKCKQLYDVLYSLTRGSIKPSRVTQISKPKLRELSDISSEKTLNANLLSLQLTGLIKVSTDVTGKHGGNIYEILTPEELLKPTPVTPVTPVTPDMGGNPSNGGQKLPPVPPVETTPRTPGSNPINIEGVSDANTLIKTYREKTDDERIRAAFGDFELILDKTIVHLTGRKTTETDRERWKHVAEILAAQLELIASRTSITNAPAVLAEHLHRHLNNKRVQERMGLITPSEVKAVKNAQESGKPKETIPDLHLCPDCFGTTFWNPDGKGRRAGCTHPHLDDARARAKKNGEVNE